MALCYFLASQKVERTRETANTRTSDVQNTQYTLAGSSNDIIDGRGVGARLRDSDTGNDISEGSSEVEGEAGSDSEGSGGNGGVSSAGRVNEELFMSGEVLSIINSSEGEAESGASSETIINKELTANVVSSGSAGVIVSRIDGGKEDTVEFVDVGDDEVSTLVFNPVRAVREDDRGDTACLSVSDNGLTKAFRADALLVISDDEGVEGMVEGVVGELEEFRKKNVGVACIIFEIESEDLMVFRDDADLSGGRVIGEDKTARVDVKGVEEFEEGLAVVVVTDEAGEGGVEAEGSEAAGDVSSATRGGIALSDLSDGNGGVRGELIEFSEVELIEHDVAGNEDTG